jgi:nucleoside-diphosphate-sugar epimerase
MAKSTDKSGNKILITGGAGFIGLHLARLHAKRGDDVTLTDNFFRGKDDPDLQDVMKAKNVKLIELDLTVADNWDKLGDGYGYVYHLAAVNGTDLFYKIPHEVLRINLLTAIYGLEWFRTNNAKGKILFTSSNEAYAGGLESFNQLPIPTPENVPLVISDVSNPRWTYAATKAIGEQLFIHYATSYKLRMVIVRPHNFYGPRAGFNHVIPQFIGRIVKRTDPFPIYGSDDTRSFCYIQDAVEAMQLVMFSDKTDGETYHIGSHDETVIKDLAEDLFKVAGWRPKKIEIHGSPAGSVKRRLADVRKIKKAVGWEAKTSLEDGLSLTYDWYKDKFSD